MTGHGKIDVHAHYLPARYREALVAAGVTQPDGMPQIPAWSAEEHVGVMDRLGIANVASVRFVAGVCVPDEAAAVNRLVR